MFNDCKNMSASQDKEEKW